MLFRSRKGPGNANAQCNLGLMHFNGHGVPQSNSEAAHWINLAYKQGSERAVKLLDEHGLWDDIQKYYFI